MGFSQVLDCFLLVSRVSDRIWVCAGLFPVGFGVSDCSLCRCSPPRPVSNMNEAMVTHASSGAPTPTKRYRSLRLGVVPGEGMGYSVFGLS